MVILAFQELENLAQDSLLNKYRPIESFPKDVLSEKQEDALLFKHLATLRTDAPVFSTIQELQWLGSTAVFAEFTEKAGEPRLLERAKAVAAKVKTLLTLAYPCISLRLLSIFHN